MAVNRSLSFIKNKKLRAGIERDLNELKICARQGALKASMIMGGSITEAALLDLLSRGKRKVKALAVFKQRHPKRKVNSLEELSLADLLQISVDLNLLPGDVVNPCYIIKDWRNLIHPGRELVGKGSIDIDRAKMAELSTRLVLKELGKASLREESYGAEQVIGAIFNDENVDSICEHLVDGLSSKERNKLLLIIPQVFISEHPTIDLRVEESLVNYFRSLRLKCSKKSRAQVLERLCEYIRQGDSDVVKSYTWHFLNAIDLQYISEEKQLLIFDYFFNWLKRVMREEDNFAKEREVLPFLEKFSPFVPIARRSEFYEVMLELVLNREYTNRTIPQDIIISAAETPMGAEARFVIERMKKEIASYVGKTRIKEAISRWEKQLRRLDALVDLMDLMGEDIPF
ncbi:MAG: hypothetical protein QMD08_04725 [Actinomycetota bacterium]|nr:hypothetical protein [Actinomycetota bacterium]